MKKVTEWHGQKKHDEIPWKKATEWRDRMTWRKETRRNAMASLNYLYLKVTRCSACTLPRSVQAEQGRKLMRKRARKRSNYKSHAPGLTIFPGRHTPGWHHSSAIECRTWGEELWEEPEQANASEEPLPLYNPTSEMQKLMVSWWRTQLWWKRGYWRWKLSLVLHPETSSLSTLLVSLKSSDKL